MIKMNTKFLILIIYSTNIFIGCFAQDICSSKTTCQDCIQQATCVWCITQNISTINCIPKKDKAKCETNQIENPKSEVKIKSNDPNSIISPTEIDIKIRSNQTQKFNFTFTQPKDFPVDLYFLMDISFTMKEHRNNLSSLASEIVVTMKNYTSDIRMGFGSFVDKPISPYAYLENGKLINPCKDCAKPYSFQNHLPLSNDINKFSREVNTTKLSGNRDVPEGSLEALMQAIVCKDEIGWRENARRLIILSTDTTFHIAGDGKLAGIDKPNDGLCHLKNNIYTHSLELDYPSVGQIAKKIKENNVIVIFAVTEPAKKIYEQLKHRIHSSFIGILSAQETIVNIMQKIFDNIANTVRINENFGNEFKIEFDSKCEKFNHLNATCPNVKPGESISFTATLELIKCPKDTLKQNYKIYPSGLNKYISINVEYLCQCSCEQTSQKFSPSCSNIGEFECGICKCPSHKIGKSCECDKTTNSASNLFWDVTNCMKANSTEICSGAGNCYCGQCMCEEKPGERNKIYGKYCECNDNACYNEYVERCSNHGTCACGLCTCYSGWTGQKCDCTESVETCMKPNSLEVCSGMKGNCVCGKCECTELYGHKFFGDYCETCLTCPRCIQYRSCVECKQFKQGVYDELQCEQNCGNFTFVQIDDVTKIEEGESCEYRDDNNCLFKYKYIFNIEQNTTKIYVQHAKQECSQTASLTFWAGIPILSILAAALIGLVIFKIVQSFQYRQEYAKFVEQCGLATNELNPLYKSPNVTVQNPLYGLN